MKIGNCKLEIVKRKNREEVPRFAIYAFWPSFHFDIFQFPIALVTYADLFPFLIPTIRVFRKPWGKIRDNSRPVDTKRGSVYFIVYI